MNIKCLESFILPEEEGDGNDFWDRVNDDDDEDGLEWIASIILKIRTTFGKIKKKRIFAKIWNLVIKINQIYEASYGRESSSYEIINYGFNLQLTLILMWDNHNMTMLEKFKVSVMANTWVWWSIFEAFCIRYKPFFKENQPYNL